MGGKHKRDDTRDMVLQAVVDAKDGIESADVAAIVKMTRSATQHHLLRLIRERVIHRQLLGGRKGYLYRAGTNGPVIPLPVEEEEPEESDADIDSWFLAEGFGAAIETARPHWRIGELFPPTRPLDKQPRMWYNRGA